MPIVRKGRPRSIAIAFRRYFEKLLKQPDTAITERHEDYMRLAFKAGADWEKNRIKPRNF